MKSDLVTYTNLTDNHSGKRKHAVDRITPHCFVGQVTAKRGCDYFAETNRKCSANYVIGRDGDIGLSVDEDNRSWCSSSSENDNRAITIECASDSVKPYAMTDAVYRSLVKLCVDICQRYNKTKLLWISSRDKALKYEPAKDEMLITVHRWFANKSCPGEWLYKRLGELAADVTKQLNPDKVVFCIQLGAFEVHDYAEAMLKKVRQAGFEDAYITTKVIKK